MTMKTMRLMRMVREASLSLSLVISSSGLAQISGWPPPTNTTIPVVTIRATDPQAVWPGNAGVFTVFRSGNPEPALNVWYQIGGTASNGVDYQTIGQLAYIPSGVASADIVINPLQGAASLTKTVVLTLTNSPLMQPLGMPVNYIIGSPSSDTVYITSGPATNIPPVVSIASPPDGAVFFTPVNLPIVACAKDIDGFVRSVQFFADGVSLGIVTNPVNILPGVDTTLQPMPPMPPYRPFVLVWSNAPAGTNIVLTAKATDNMGASSLSAPVSITIHPGPPPSPPPPPNLPPVVRITSPPNNSVFRAPINLPLYAYAADKDGWVAGVEFFVGTTDLGPGQRIPPSTGTGSAPLPSPVSVTNFWGFVWTNPPPSTSPYALTAVATDNAGASTVSAVVNVSILPELPPPVITNLVGIVAIDPIAIEGTNCWPWLGLAACAPSWSNWTATSAVCRYFTNCGPKNALFAVRRFGPTNSDLTVAYGIAGTATNGLDYVTLPGAVTIPAGHRAALIPIVPIDDGPPDLTSTVVLKLTPSGAYMLEPGHSAAAAIILDGPTRPPLASVLPDRCFRINSTGPDGAWFRIESTTDLRNWTPVCTNQIFGGSLDFIDAGSQADRLRFYRAVSEANAP
jgi:Bacterial Ig domain